MTAIESSNANYFSTTLSSAITAASTSITLADVGSLTSPAYLVIDPNSDSKREVIYADGTWSGNTITLTTSNNRGLSGSAAGAQPHDAGTLVVSVPLAQHLEDVHDRVDQHDHTGGTEGVDLTQYSLVDGTRAFTGTVGGITPSADTDLATKAYIDARQPTGSVQMFAGGTAPSGWLLCDGSAVSRTTYAGLYAVIGDAFGAGDGSTTFNLPDLRDNFPVGAGTTYGLGNTGGVDSVTLTEAQIPAHTHTGPDHNHSISHTHSINPPPTSTGTQSANHTHDAGSYTVTNVYHIANDVNLGDENAERARATSANRDFAVSGTSGGNSVSHTHSVNIAAFTSGGSSATNSGNAGTGATGPTGGGGSHENRPPYIALNFIIRT